VEPPAPRADAGHARRLAAGSLAQQAAQVTGLLTIFAIVTVLARELSLTELGVFGLLSSLAGYLLIVQNAAASAAVRTMAAAPDEAEFDRVYSTALGLYVAGGIAAGVLVAGLGVLLSAGLDLTSSQEHQARLGSLLLGAVTAVGWPVTVHRDVLRARGLFVRAAATEIAALVAYAALVLSLAASGAALSLVIGASGAIPLLAGLGCLVVARVSRAAASFTRAGVGAGPARALLGLAGYVSLTEAVATAIYAANRAILGVFTSAATVGLLEGPVRAHNLIRSLNSATTVTAVPASARLQAENDERRLRQLLLRGTRYTLALIVPLAVTGMVLASPLLRAWLGPGFGRGGPAMAIMLSHWLVNGCSGVMAAVLIGTGRARELARWAAAVAVGDIVLALALAPPFGLEGVAIATAVPYALAFPLLLRSTLRAVPVTTVELVRQAFGPALGLAVALAAVLGMVRVGLDPRSAGALAVTSLTALAAYWAGYWIVFLSPEERRLVRDISPIPVPRGRR
jgi:O-antigen/teichoic acid export membrane protein